MSLEENNKLIQSLYPWARKYDVGGPLIDEVLHTSKIQEVMKSYEKFARGGNVGFGNLYEPGGRLGNFRQYNKAMNELEEKYGMASPSMGLSRREAKRQFRQNKAQMWDSYYKTKSVYDQLAAERPVEWNVEQRVANALGNSNDAMDAGNSVRSTMLARQYPVMKNYAEAQRRYWHPTDQERKNDIAERRDYRGMTPWLTLLAASPVLFAGAPYAASAIEKAVPALGNIWRTAMGMNTIGANFMKNMIAGTAAGGGVELAAKPIVGKEFTPAMADLMFRKAPETREKHQDLTNFVASALNPGYYVGFGNMGLQYTGKLLPGLAKGARKAGMSLKDALEIGRNALQRRKSVSLPRKGIGNYVSELNWSPDDWFSTRPGDLGLPFDAVKNPVGYTDYDVKALQSHIPEYIAIEKNAKIKGTWLKMPDGSTWQGDQRSWVQLQSEPGKKLSQERLFTGMDRAKASNPQYDGDAWADRQRTMSSFWAREGEKGSGAVLEITPAMGSRFTADAKGNFWNNVPRKQDGITLPRSKDYFETSTDDIVDFAKAKGYDITQINNVREGSGDLVDDVVIHAGFPRKSLLGNNGDFNFSNRHLYRAISPFVFGYETSKINQNK